MGEWKRVKLGEICSLITKGATPRGEYQVANSKDAVAFVRAENVNGTTICRSELKCIDSSIHQRELKRSQLRDGDILITIAGAIGRTAMVDSSILPANINQAVAIIRLDTADFDRRFVLDYLRLPALREELTAISSGQSVQANLNLHQVGEIEIPCPPLPTQRRIAAVLGALDDKIEVNRKICQNLEAQAQALFKAWFVDFDPFGGKRPEGWKEVELPEVFYFQEGPGIRNWQYVTENGVRFINIRCIVDGDIRVDSANMISEEEAYGKYAHFLLHENDIVMSCSGTLGRYAIVRKDHLPLCLNTSVIRFRPKNGFSDFSWLYGYLGSEEFLSQQKALANGSVQANFGPTHLKNMKVMLPDAVTREKYHQAIYSSIQMAQTIRDENKTLAAMRDALLPKLMRGEL